MACVSPSRYSRTTRRPRDDPDAQPTTRTRRRTATHQEGTLKRIYHTWDKWECYPAGFYNTRPPRPDMTDDDCRATYKELLADRDRFASTLGRVTTEWHNSCEHYLSNERMNRIAWLGQASLTIAHGIPARYRGGYMLLTPEQRLNADLAALDALNAWLAKRGEPETTLAGAGSKNG